MLDFAVDSSRVQHLSDVVVRSRCQAFVAQPASQCVWGVSEDGTIEHWGDDVTATLSSSALPNDCSLTPVAAAAALIDSMPAMSVDVDSLVEQLSGTVAILKGAWTAESPAMVASAAASSLREAEERERLVCASLEALRRVLNYCSRALAGLFRGHASTPPLLQELSTFCLSLLNEVAPVSEAVTSTTLSLLVDGLDLFFPTWPARFAFILSLLNRPQSSAVSRALRDIDARYHALFSGRSLDTLQMDGGEELSSLFTQAALDRALALVGPATDSKLLSLHSRPLSAVLVYLSQLFTSMQMPPASTARRPQSSLSPTAARERDTRALPAFLTVSTAVFRQAIAIIDRPPASQNSAAPASNSPLSPYDALCASFLFQLLRPLLLWLPLVLDQLAATEQALYVELDQLLHVLVLLICKLAATSSASQPTPLSLPSLISLLRDSRQLTTLQNRGGPDVHRTLMPFARSVLTEVFHAFATTAVGPPATAAMSFDDFLRYYIHCHLPLVTSSHSSATANLPPSINNAAQPTSHTVIPIHTSATMSTTGGAVATGAASHSHASSEPRLIPIAGGGGDGDHRVPLTFVSGREVPLRQVIEFGQAAAAVSAASDGDARVAEAATAGREMARHALLALISGDAARQQGSEPAPAPSPLSQPLALEAPRSSPFSNDGQSRTHPPPPPQSSRPSAEEPARVPVVLLPSVPPPPPVRLQSVAQSTRSLAPPISPSAAVALQARLVFQKILSTCTGATAHLAASAAWGAGGGRIDLATFLRYQLEMSAMDEKAVLEQLRLLSLSYDWSRHPRSASPALESGPSPPLPMDAVLSDLKVVYSRALAHVYPSPAVVHGGTNPASEHVPSVVSISSLPGVMHRPATGAVESGPVDYEEVVGRLLQSQAHWMQHPQHAQHRLFLERFITTDPEQVARERQERELQRQKRKEALQQRMERKKRDIERKQRFSQTAPIAKSTESLVVYASQSIASGRPSDTSLTAVDVDEAAVSQSLKELEERGQKAQHDRPLSPLLHGSGDGRQSSPSSSEVEERRLKALQDEKWPEKVEAKLLSFAADDGSSRSEAMSSRSPSPLPSPSPSPSPSPPPVSSDSEISLSHEIEEPSLCLSNLFLRCLSELGGGLSKRRIESWKAAVSAEKAYAAALLKHHGYTERAVRYSNSIQIVELLREATAPSSRTRCLAHPSCPQWLKSVVQATFRDVRTPLLNILRALDETEEAVDGSAAQGQAEEKSAEPGHVAAAAARGEASSPQSPRAAAAKLIDCVATNCAFLLQHIDSIELDVHSSLQRDDDRGEEVVGAEGRPAVSFADSSTVFPPAPPADEALSPPPNQPTGTSSAAGRVSTSHRRRHSLLSIQPSGNVDLQQFTAPTVGQSEAGAANDLRPEAVQGAAQQEGDMPMARSFSTRPLRAPPRPSHSHHASLSAAPLWSVSSSSSSAFLSQPFDPSWLSALVHSEFTLELQGSLRPTLQRYHSVALLRLKLLQTLNQQFARGHQQALMEHVIPALLPCLARAKQQAHLLYNSRLLLSEEESQSALLSFYKRIVDAINDPAGSTPASAPLPLSYASPSWLTLKRCLHLFNVHFLPEDASTVIGSGGLSALSRWMSRIDTAIDRKRLRSQESTAQPSPDSSALASRTATRSHTRSSSRVLPAHRLTRPPSPSSFTAGYHLKMLMWQTYKLLSLFYLAQQQRQRLEQLQAAADADVAPSLTTSSPPSKGDNVVISTLGDSYLSTLLTNLSRISQSPPRLPLDREDGLLSQTIDAGRMLLHFARLPQPICTPLQLVRLLSASRVAPPTTVQSIVQLLGYELGKVSPKDFDQHMGGSAAAASLTSASPTVTSTFTFVSALLGELARHLQATSAIPSLSLLLSMLASRSTRSPSYAPSRDNGERKQAEPPIRIDEESSKLHSRHSYARRGLPHPHSAPSQFTPALPSASSPSASHSAEQSWLPDDQLTFNPARCAVVEELILVLRSLCQERQWCRIVLSQLIEAVLLLPSVTAALTSLADPDAPTELHHPRASHLSLPRQLPLSLAALAVLGGWRFTLHSGAEVEVSMRGDFSSAMAAPSPSPLLTSLTPTSTIRRGSVHSFDLTTNRATVLTSTSQPRVHQRPYKVGEGAQLPMADAVRVELSLDQLRTIPSISAPNLNDSRTFETTWAALLAVLSTTTRHCPSPLPQLEVGSQPLTADVASIAWLSLLQVQQLTVNVVLSQATMAQRSQLTAASSSALRQPAVAAFDAALSPTLGPVSLSPPPSPSPPIDSTVGPLTSSPSFSQFSLSSSSEGSPQGETWTLQPTDVALSIRSDRSPPSSHIAPRIRQSCSSPPPVSHPVDYTAFVPALLALSSPSPNYLLSFSPYSADVASRQLTHRLTCLVSTEVQRQLHRSSIATRLSRLASRAASRAISRGASGAATPQVHSHTGQAGGSEVGTWLTEEHPALSTPPPHAALSIFPSPAQPPPRLQRRAITIIDDTDTARPTATTSPPPAVPALTSPSYLPHFIIDQSDDLHIPVWSPTAFVEQLLLRLHRQHPSHTFGPAHPPVPADEDPDADQLEEPGSDDSPVDEDESREMRVHAGADGVDDDERSRASFPPTHPDEEEGEQDEYNDDGDFHLAEDDDILEALLDEVRAGPPPSSFALAGAASAAAAAPPLIFQHLDGLTSIGYPDHCARFALARCGGNLHDALEFLLSGEITLYDEYRQVAAANAAFQRLLERLHLSAGSSAGAANAASTIDPPSAPLVSRHFATSSASERRLLIAGIQHLCTTQPSAVADLSVYDWVDARDMYGQWFLAQVLQRRTDPAAFIVHFFGWDDAYNERILLPSERLRPASLFDATWRRLEDERQHRRAKVYGPALHAWMKAERAKGVDHHHDQHHQLASVHMHDPYSFPPLTSLPTLRSKDFYSLDPTSPTLLGTLAHLTTEAIEALHHSLALGPVDLSPQFAVGNRLMVIDTVGKLCEAEIIEVRGGDIRIHYPGWGGKWDETLPMGSARIYGRKGSNRRRPRLHQWKGVSGVTGQLFGLVGKVGVVTAKRAMVGEGGADKGEGKAEDVCVRVEVFDEEVGSAFAFWTRLSLLKKVSDASDCPSLSLSALLTISRPQLIHTSISAEQSRLARQAGTLLTSLIATFPAPAAPLGFVSLFASPSTSFAGLSDELLSSLPIWTLVRGAAYQSSANGWMNDQYHGVGESSVSLLSHHVQPIERVSAAAAAAGHSGAVAAEAAMRSSHTSDAEARAEDSRRTWWDDRRYRVEQSTEKREQLSALSSLSRLFISPSTAETTPPTLPTLHPSTVQLLMSFLLQVTSSLHSHLRGAASQFETEEPRVLSEVEETAEAEESDVSLLSLLSEVGVSELEQGHRVRLFLDSPNVDSLMVTWIRTSQPHFDVQFFQCADQPFVPAPSSPADFLSPNRLAPSPTIATAPAPASNDSEESIQLHLTPLTESSPPPPSPVGAVPQGTPTTALPAPPSSVAQLTASLPPPLALLKWLPPLKVAGVPLMVPNPCYVQIGGAKRGREELADVAEDELHLVITPHSDGVTERAAAAVELFFHVKRELRAQTARLSEEQLRTADDGALTTLRQSFASLAELTRTAVRFWSNHLLSLHMACPWPSVPKVRSVELLSHLLLEVKEDAHPSHSDAALVTPSPAPSQEPLALEWLKLLASEARLRFGQEKEGWPLYSSYLHRLLELLTIATYIDMVQRIAQRKPAAPHPATPLTPHERLVRRIELAKDVEELCSPATATSSREDLDRFSRSVSLTTYCQRHFHLPLHIISGVVLHAAHLAEQVQHPADCVCPHCDCQRGKDAHTSQAVLLMDFHSSFWPLMLGGASPLILPSTYRSHLFDEVINATTSIERTQPEFIFSTSKDKALEASSSTSPTSLSGFDSVLSQLFSQLSVTSPHHFRIKMNDIPFKAMFKGAFHRGAQGTPGPFRQALTDVCADLRRSSPTSLLIPCPNFVHDTGLNRNALILNPSCAVPVRDALCLGQLMGIALRSTGVLDIDLASALWKQLMELEVDDEELAEFDFTAWRTLQFRDPTQPTQPMTEVDWVNHYGENLTWTTLASDQMTQLHLRPPSTPPRYVRYHERFEYARAVIHARLHESRHLLNAIKGGLYSIVPRAALRVLTWRELQHRVCGDSELDLAVLARHTVYAPKRFTEDSDIVAWLWRTLRGFSSEERGHFLQFCLARSRLPPVTSREGSWRMKVNVLEAAGPNDLPSAETCNTSTPHRCTPLASRGPSLKLSADPPLHVPLCFAPVGFFNLNLPLYHSEATLRAKLLLAITHCSSINS